MKVKMGEAKTHLSRLVKEVNETGEPLELCVREETVAYLMPAKKPTAEELEREAFKQRLKENGLILTKWPKRSPKCPVELPDKPLREGNAILEIRAERDY
jgi:prevent-host-death family protein